MENKSLKISLSLSLSLSLFFLIVPSLTHTLTPYPVFATTFSPSTGWSSKTVTLTLPEVLCYDPHPTVAMNNQGCAIAVWINDSAGYRTNSTAIVQVSTYIPKIGWSNPMSLSSDGVAILLSDPVVAINGFGDAIIAWLDSNSLIQMATYTATTKSWSSTFSIRNNAGDAVIGISQQVALNAKGDAVIVWEDDNAYEIQASIFNSMSNVWSQIYNVGAAGSSFGGFSRDESNVAINSFGEIFVIWDTSPTTGQSSIQVRNFSPSGGWGGVRTLTALNSNSSSSKITLNDAGQACALWFNGALGAFQASTYNIKTGWLPTYTLSSTSNTPPDDPAVMINSSGNILATWIAGTTGSYSIQASLFNQKSGTWTLPVTISPSMSYAFSLKCAYNSLGNGIVTWCSGNTSTVQASTYSAAKGWSTPINISPAFIGGGSTPTCSVALNSSNNALAVFGAFN